MSSRLPETVQYSAIPKLSALVDEIGEGRKLLFCIVHYCPCQIWGIDGLFYKGMAKIAKIYAFCSKKDLQYVLGSHVNLVTYAGRHQPAL